jgi:ferredoxin
MNRKCRLIPDKAENGEGYTMKRIPVIDLGRCTECGGCIEVAPTVFRYNTETGMMEVIDLVQYPVDLVDEAIKNCPEDCITWETDR